MEPTMLSSYDDDIVLTKEEFLEVLIQIHDRALCLLSQEEKISPKIIKDQEEFLEKMAELIEEDIITFSLEHVQSMLPYNSWLPQYRKVIPLLDAFVQDEETASGYHA